MISLDVQRFNQLTEKFRDKSILVLGDFMLDQYFRGNTDRISPEAPVPVVNVESISASPGGAGNVAMNLRGLHSRVFACGMVGTDSNGETLKQLLRNEHIGVDGLFRYDDTPTIVKTRIIARNQQILRTDFERLPTLTESQAGQILGFMADSLDSLDAIILADYNKGLLTLEIIRAVLKLAGKAGVPVYVDPKKDHFLKFRKVRLFKPNTHEFLSSLNRRTDISEAEFQALGNDLRTRLEADMVLITRGALGMALFLEDGYHSIPTRARSVHDVSGAGDTVISVFTLADLAGGTPEESATLANLAAGRVCEEPGVIPITVNLLREIFNHHLFS